MSRWFLFLSLIFTCAAHGQGVGGFGLSGCRDYRTTKCLCTVDNKEESYFKEGDCVSLKEQLTVDKCTADVLEKIRQKVVAQLSDNPPRDPNQRFDIEGLTCSSRQGQTGWKQIASDKAAFGTVIMQFIMSFLVAESNLDTFMGLEKGPGVNINADKQGGIANLTLAKMDEPKYNKDSCGCKVTNSQELVARLWFWSLLLGESVYAQPKVGKFLAGRSPGPRDDHHSIQCAAYMALYEAEKDGILFGGNRRTGPSGAQPITSADNTPKGAAKIFASLQELDGPRNSPDPNDPDLAVNPALNFVKKKVRTYCEKNLNESGGLNRTFEDDFPGGGTAIR